MTIGFNLNSPAFGILVKHCPKEEAFNQMDKLIKKEMSEERFSPNDSRTRKNFINRLFTIEQKGDSTKIKTNEGPIREAHNIFGDYTDKDNFIKHDIAKTEADLYSYFKDHLGYSCLFTGGEIGILAHEKYEASKL